MNIPVTTAVLKLTSYFHKFSIQEADVTEALYVFHHKVDMRFSEK